MRDRKFAILAWFLIFSVGVWAFIKTLHWPVIGEHSIRQADTLMTGVFYCYERAPFLEPRVSFRGNLEKGIAIRVFPLQSWLFSLWCQATGEWVEWWPKLIVLLLSVSGLWFIGRVHFVQPSWMLLTAFSTPFFWKYLLRPLPDSLSLFLFGLGVYVWNGCQEECGRNCRWCKFSMAISIFLFVVSYLVRPYIIFGFPLLLWTGKKTWIENIRINLGPLFLMFVAIGIAHMVWYKWYAVKISEISYYYIGFPPFLWFFKAEFSNWLMTWGKSFLETLFFNQGFFLVIVLFVFQGKNIRIDQKSVQLLLLSVIAYLTVLGLRSEHAIIHDYYFLGAWLLMMVAATQCIQRTPRPFQYLAMMSLVTLIHTQHSYHSLGVDIISLRSKVDSISEFKDRFCLLGFERSRDFYFMLRSGSFLECEPGQIVFDVKPYFVGGRDE